MYEDYSPVPNVPAKFGAKKVVVIEKSDKPYTLLFVDQVIEFARSWEATSHHDGEIFWIVFADEPRRLWDMTESALRSSLRRPKSERLSKERILAMGDDAPIGEILESFEYGNLHDFARREMPAVCRELEVTTIGEIAKLKRSDITGPQSRLAGNKTLSYINAVLREFGKPELRHFENA